MSSGNHLTVWMDSEWSALQFLSSLEDGAATPALRHALPVPAARGPYNFNYLDQNTPAQSGIIACTGDLQG